MRPLPIARLSDPRPRVLTTSALGLAVIVCAWAWHAPAQAQPAEPHADGGRWSLGLAISPEVRPYRNFDEGTELMPVIRYENQWLRVTGPGLEVKLGATGPVQWGLSLSYARDGYKPSDSPDLAGMDRRRDSAWAGLRASLPTPYARFNAEWSADASGHSDGQKLRLTAQRRVDLGTVALTPRVGATWLDSRYTRYYFGVQGHEARVLRPSYQPGSTVNTEIGLRLDHTLAPRHQVFADLSVTLLGSAIKNSPLVDRSSLPHLRVGYQYQF